MRLLAKKMVAVGLASTLCVAAVAGPAYAYFTDVVRASGQHSLTLGYSSELHEELDGLNKKITIENTGNTDVMVRVQIFGIENRPGMDISVKGSNWQKAALPAGQEEGQVWEYTQVLPPKATTDELLIEVKQTITDQLLGEFDIIVIGQTSPAAYDEAGNPYAYNWK